MLWIPKPSLKDRIKMVFMKIGISILSLVFLLLPFWLYLMFRYTMTPEGFWQNFILICGTIYMLGGLQIILMVVWLWFLVILWRDG